ncbi:protein atonal homolog 8 [Thalassophryne amazonica]|uniref:protein atonal homolog 8 n=1 Tax=Thalassophryne amazonica TaxID=390379 RepID=UPI001471F716|nr:protein atonal homolog 8 [Thalassophryne amazonica]
MKNPHIMSHPWNGLIKNTTPALITMPGGNKKFKRKSREPRRIFSSIEAEAVRSVDVDVDVDEPPVEQCGGSRLAPLHRQMTGAQEVMSNAAGLTGGKAAAAPSAAIDMRIGSNIPAIVSKLSHLPASSFADPEICHWPPSISQPLSNRLKLGFHSTFPLSTTTSKSKSPLHTVPLDSTLTVQTAGLPASAASQGDDQAVEHHVQLLKESPRKRLGGSTDGSGHVPEFKAIQQTRRLLANARERTRVHTISAAFEALRKQVPCYSYGQKLSKLAILRIACNYIVSLAQLAELDYSPDHSSLSFSQCVEQCTRTLQAEGRSKKRKVGRIPEDA